MKPKIKYLLLAILFLAAFFFFSRSVRAGAWQGRDYAATVRLQAEIDTSKHLRIAALIDNVFEGSTFLASPGFSIAIVVILTLLTAVDFKNRKIRIRAFLIPLLFVLLVLGEIYGKTVVHHPSPPFSMIKHPTTFFPENYINEQFSYPSGHAARAVFISFLIYSLFAIRNSSFVGKRRIIVRGLLIKGLLVYVALVSLSRIYLGHHWLSDVVGGWLLGAGLSFLTLFTL